jgi:hypothetical protein
MEMELPVQPYPASGLQMVAMAYNNMGKDMLNGHGDRRYQGLADQLKPIGWHQDMLIEASDAGDRKELIADGKSGDVDFPHSSFQPILTIGSAPERPVDLMLSSCFGRRLERCPSVNDSTVVAAGWRAGEYDAKTGYVPVGVPDGMGAYLKDQSTVRLVFQAESYGHISGNPSWCVRCAPATMHPKT